jgi:hypothetical protein
MWMLHMQRRGGERRAYIPSFWLSGGAMLGGYYVAVFVLVFFFSPPGPFVTCTLSSVFYFASCSLLYHIPDGPPP